MSKASACLKREKDGVFRKFKYQVIGKALCERIKNIPDRVRTDISNSLLHRNAVLSTKNVSAPCFCFSVYLFICLLVCLFYR